MIEALIEHTIANLDYAISVRHRLHQVAEPSNAEHETAAIIAAELKSSGLDPQTGIGGTGVVAELAADPGGPLVVLRADMDALPVTENSGHSYQSTHPGHCHCCGHDGHMATMVGAARVLSLLREQVPGRVRFLFQPAEELGSGALQMIRDGALQAREAAAIIGLHASPGQAAGNIVCRPGVISAGMDVFSITIAGKGGHTARPGNARNPVDTIAALVPALRSMSHDERVVCVGAVNAGQRPNVIAEEGVLRGTCRTLSREAREQSCAEIRDLAHRVAAATRTQAVISFDEGCPPVINDPKLVTQLEALCADLAAGGVRYEHLDSPSMGSEDFSFYGELAPGIMFRLGIGEGHPDLHTPEFDFEDDALKSAMLASAGLAIRVLEGSKGLS